MHLTRSTFSTGIALAITSLFVAACGQQPGTPAPTSPTAGGSSPAAAAKDDHMGHDHADDHSHDEGDDHGHGPTVELGEQSSNGFTIKASRDGDITPGGDAPIDVWVTGGSAKVSAVRFWIGTQDAKGSMKAKAELEKDNWHTHAEVPAPLPAGSKLWIEIETETPEKFTVGFDLKS